MGTLWRASPVMHEYLSYGGWNVPSESCYCLAPSCHIHQKALGLLRSAFLFPSPLLHMADPFPARPKKPPKKSSECMVTDSETISATTEMSSWLLRMSEGNSRELCQNKHTHSPLVLHRAYPGSLSGISGSPLPAFNKYTFTHSEQIRPQVGAKHGDARAHYAQVRGPDFIDICDQWRHPSFDWTHGPTGYSVE